MGKTKPKVSIIVPAYDAEKTLKRCLDSLFDQDWNSYEVILVNDGSTDGTLGVADFYARKPNFLVLSQSNKGIARSRWLGIRSSRGEYVGFVDADDCVKPNMFSKMYGRARASNADLAVCNWISVGDINLKHNLYKDSTIDDVEKNVDLLIFKRCDGHLCNKLFKRELLCGEVFERTYEVKYYEDIYFSSFLVPRVKRITYLSDYLYYRFVHPASITQSLPKEALLDFFTVHERIYHRFLQDSNEFYVKKAPGLFVKGLIDITIALKRKRDLDDDLQKMGKEINTKFSNIPLRVLLRSRPGMKTILLWFLLKYDIYDSVRSLWLRPCFKPLRYLGNRYLRLITVENNSYNPK